MAAPAAIPMLQLGHSVMAPALVYGTGTAWFNKTEQADSKALVSAVSTAIKLGFRHIDCAEMYKNEQHVGQAIRESHIPRHELFVTSKIYPSLDNPEAGLRASLERLGLSYLDLYLVHAPFTFQTPESMQEAWAKLEDCVSLGLTRTLGVSNFRVQDLQQLLKTARVKPAVNQVEFHPYLQSPELLSFCREHDIKLEAYGGLAPILGASGGPLDPILNELAAKHGKTAAQVLIRWTLQNGCLVVTTTSKVERMEEYLGVGEFALSSEEVDMIDRFGKMREYRRFWVQNFVQTKL